MSTTIVPPGAAIGPSQRTEQARLALEGANRVRSARAVLLRRLGAHTPQDSWAMAADMVEDPPDLLASLRVMGLLQGVRKVGPSGAQKICVAARVDPLTRLRDLESGERRALAAVLRIRWARLGGGSR